MPRRLLVLLLMGCSALGATPGAAVCQGASDGLNVLDAAAFQRLNR